VATRTAVVKVDLTTAVAKLFHNQRAAATELGDHHYLADWEVAYALMEEGIVFTRAELQAVLDRWRGTAKQVQIVVFTYGLSLEQ